MLATVRGSVLPHLDAARKALDDGDAAAARVAITAALDQLRSLARGVFPAVLAEGGLGPGLRSWAESRVVPVSFTATGDVTRRFHPAAEAALYVGTVRLAAAAAERSPSIEPPAVHLDVGDASAIVEVNSSGTAWWAGEVESAVRDRVEGAGGMLVAADHAVVATMPLSGTMV
jgi:hypothetical protein